MLGLTACSINVQDCYPDFMTGSGAVIDKMKQASLAIAQAFELGDSSQRSAMPADVEQQLRLR